MGGLLYLPIIIIKYSLDENPFDILKMLNILATERATYLKRKAKQKDYDFAAKIICILLAVIKPPNYKRKMESMRIYLTGIRREKKIQKEFVDMILEPLLRSKSAEEAIELGFDKLFNYSYNDETNLPLQPAF